MGSLRLPVILVGAAKMDLSNFVLGGAAGVAGMAGAAGAAPGWAGLAGTFDMMFHDW